MKKAFLYTKLNNKQVRCRLCYRKCIIKEGTRGYCLSRINLKGNLYSLIYGIISNLEPTPIEDKPILSFRSGTQCLSVGTYGCNFRCEGCQNHEISWGEDELNALSHQAITLNPENVDKRRFPFIGFNYLSPSELIKKTLELNCKGIAFTYNEPTIWAEYVLDSAKRAREFNLYTVYVTNSWLTPEHIDVIGPYIDAMALDIKSLDNRYYAELCNIEDAVDRVLKTCLYAAKRYSIHVETRTCIVTGYNDNPEMLYKIATWIKNNLGEDSPWHILRFFPKHHLNHMSPTPMEALEKTVQIGRNAGLSFVNVVADKGCD